MVDIWLTLLFIIKYGPCSQCNSNANTDVLNLHFEMFVFFVYLNEAKDANDNDVDELPERWGYSVDATAI